VETLTCLAVVALMTRSEDDPRCSSVVEMNAATMDTAELFEGDYVQVIAKKGRRTVLLVMPNESLPDGSIALNDVQRRNLGVSASDYVTLETANPGDLTSVSLAPIKETIEGIAGNIGYVYIVPFFKVDTWVDPTTRETVRDFRRVVRKDDLIRCRGAGRDIWCKVIDVAAADGNNFGRVVPAGGGAVTTEVKMLDAIPLEQGESQLNAIGWDDIGGLDEEIKRIRQVVELPLKHPILFTTMGVRAPKGVLLHGPPGTGKTMIAKAIENETGVKMFVVNGPSIVAGDGARGIESTFAEARKIAEREGACLIFMDEVDAIAPNRERIKSDEAKQIVTALLAEMDGIGTSDHVMVIATTNRPNVLDPAIRRAGRFDTEVLIPSPSREARFDILKKLTRRMKLELKDPYDSVDLWKIAEVTHGYVGADLASVCMKAAVNCVRDMLRAGTEEEKEASSAAAKDAAAEDTGAASSSASASASSSAAASGHDDDEDLGFHPDASAMPLLDFEEDDIPAEWLDKMTILQSDFMAALNVTTASTMREVAIERPSTRFKDIGGLDEVKKAMRDMVEMPVKYPGLFKQMGMSPPSGALMYGPPGCGKTLIAKAMANECGVNFISIKGPQLMTKWFGESEENVRDIFNKARQAAPCILFFDELDSIARTRGGWGASSAGGVHDRVVNQLLTELDGVIERKSVFVIGATNLPDAIDPALRRPGRLDQLIYVPMPDAEARRSIFKAVLRKSVVARDVDVDALSDSCEDFTGSDIAGLCQMAIKISVRERLKKVMDVFHAAGGKGKKAMRAAKEATKNWPMTVDCFQRARASSKPSVGRAALQEYIDSKARLEANMGGMTGGTAAAAAAAASAGLSGAFHKSAAPATGGAADIADDDIYA
jgi:transitional endoplasmic reticulum ATPase